jgi:hypothetical protein
MKTVLVVCSGKYDSLVIQLIPDFCYVIFTVCFI